jgi:cytochrome P450
MLSGRKKILSQPFSLSLQNKASFFSSSGNSRFAGITQLPGYPILGRALDLLRPNGTLDNLKAAAKVVADDPKGMCYYTVGDKSQLLITNPDHIREFLFDHRDKQSRMEPMKLLEQLFGSNILSDPDYLARKKRIAIRDNYYDAAKLKQHAKVVAAETYRCRENPGCNGDNIDLTTFCDQFSVRVFLKSAFGAQVTEQDIQNVLGFVKYLDEEIFDMKGLAITMLPPILRHCFFWSKYSNPEKLKNTIKEKLLTDFLKPKESLIANTPSLFHDFWKMGGGSNVPFNEHPNMIGDSTMFILGGYNTTNFTIQSTIKLMGAHPEIQDKLCAELNKCLQGRQIEEEGTLEQVAQIEYLEMVIKEILRIAPATYHFPRGIDKPFVFQGIPLEKGDTVHISPYIMHFSKRYWEEPERFMPERFAKENAKNIKKFTYIPFGMGAKDCIGQDFAKDVIRTWLAGVCSQYRIEVQNNVFDLSLEKGSPKYTHPAQLSLTPLNKEHKHKSIHLSI